MYSDMTGMCITYELFLFAFSFFLTPMRGMRCSLRLSSSTVLGLFTKYAILPQHLIQPLIQATSRHRHLQIISEQRVLSLSIIIQRQVQKTLKFDEGGPFDGFTKFSM